MNATQISSAAATVVKQIANTVVRILAFCAQVFAAAIVCNGLCEYLAQGSWDSEWWPLLGPALPGYHLLTRNSKLQFFPRLALDAVLAGAFGAAISLVFDGSFMNAGIVTCAAFFTLLVAEEAAAKAAAEGDPYYRRGTRRRTLEEASGALDALRPAGDTGLVFGPVTLPSAYGKFSFLIFGAQGSGKTVLILRLVKSILPRFRHSNIRIYAFDAKGSLYPALRALAGPVPVRLLHPFSPVGLVWDMARDILTHRDAEETARSLAPPDRNGHPFFDGGAQAVVHALIVALMYLLRQRWTLRDVILAAADPDDCRHIIASVPDSVIGQQVLKQFFPRGEPRLSANMMASVTQKLTRFWSTAARTHHALRAGRGFSTQQWLAERSILVFGHSHRAEAAMSAFHACFFHSLKQYTLDQPNRDGYETWFVLDELSSAGALHNGTPQNDLAQLFAKGRERGVRIVLGAQELPALREIYGPDGAESILGLCGNVAGLKTSCPSTAEWLERRFGQREHDQEQPGTSSTQGPQGSSSGQSTSWHVARDPVVLASEFGSLPLINEANDVGPTGFFLIPDVGAFRGGITMQAVKRDLPPPAPGGVEDSNPHLDILQPWTNEERAALGLPPRDHKSFNKTLKTGPSSIEGLDIR